MNQANKQKLYELIDNCDNDILLAEVKQLLQSATEKDCWDKLSEDDKNLLIESEAQYEKVEFISHDELMQQFEAWKNR